jgi:hypothetical protein
MTITYTTWHRLEPRVRGTDQAEGLHARIHDPLWLIGRQWQVGELLGEDAASPVSVRVETADYGLSRWQPAAGAATDYAPDSLPLEVLVEREPPGSATLRQRLDAWTRLLALAAAAGMLQQARALAAAHPLPPPRVAEDASDANLRLIAGATAADGYAVAQTLRGDASGLPSDLASAFVAWVDAQTPQDAGDCWVTDRLEYRFSVGAQVDQTEVVLAAPDYEGGRLDWYDVDVAPTGQTLAAPATTIDSVVKHLLPMRVSFPGMPTERFWAFEDAAVDLGAVSASVEDLGRVAAVEFATVFGNDWWSVPVRAAFGSLVQVRSLVVRDSFGDNVLIQSTDQSARGGGAPWRMFRQTDATLARGSGSAPGLLFLPPVVAGGLDGPSIEELLLLRDEMANLAWGVERVVEGADGRPRDRSVEYNARLTAAPSPAVASPAALVYILQTQVPAHWIPLVPVRDPGGSAAVVLQRGTLLTQDGTARPITAQGILLQPEISPWYFHEEEVPRAGLRIRRVPAIARWLNGEVFTWTSRRGGPGGGEGSSGLQFDLAVPPTVT